MTSIEILKKLISFDTVSSNSNLELISFCKQILENAGAKVTIIKNKEETKGNLFATVFRPTPGMPGKLSDLSPAMARAIAMFTGWILYSSQTVTVFII